LVQAISTVKWQCPPSWQSSGLAQQHQLWQAGSSILVMLAMTVPGYLASDGDQVVDMT
jgi:hypothetical protein